VRCAPELGFAYIVVGVASGHGDQGKGEQEDDEQELSAGQPELGFSVGLHRDTVQQADQFVSHNTGEEATGTNHRRSSPEEDNTRNTHGSGGDIITPVGQHGVQGSDFERNQQGFVEEEVPANHLESHESQSIWAVLV
jgi:hypothetical protein